MSVFSQVAKEVSSDKLPYLNSRDGEYTLALDKIKTVKGKANGKEYRIAEFKVIESTPVPVTLLKQGEVAPVPFGVGSSVAFTIDMTSPYAGKDVAGLYAAASGMNMEQFTTENKKSAEAAFKADKASSIEEAAEKFSLLAMADAKATSETNPMRGVAIKATIERSVAGAKSKTPGAIFSNVRFAPLKDANTKEAVAARRKELGG